MCDVEHRYPRITNILPDCIILAITHMRAIDTSQLLVAHGFHSTHGKPDPVGMFISMKISLLLSDMYSNKYIAIVMDCTYLIGFMPFSDILAS